MNSSNRRPVRSLWDVAVVLADIIMPRNMGERHLTSTIENQLTAAKKEVVAELGLKPSRQKPVHLTPEWIAAIFDQMEARSDAGNHTLERLGVDKKVLNEAEGQLLPPTSRR